MKPDDQIEVESNVLSDFAKILRAGTVPPSRQGLAKNVTNLHNGDKTDKP